MEDLIKALQQELGALKGRIDTLEAERETLLEKIEQNRQAGLAPQTVEQLLHKVDALEQELHETAQQIQAGVTRLETPPGGTHDRGTPNTTSDPRTPHPTSTRGRERWRFWLQPE